MAKSSYYEGWGFNDTVKIVLKGTTAQRNKFFTEFKRVFPKTQIEKSGKEVVEVWVYDNEISNVKKLAKLFDLKVTYNDGGKTDQSVAQIILQQLGGMGRLVVMTGAYNFVALSNGVSFKIKNRKVNYVKITLNGKDLYDMEFGRIAVGKLKTTAEHNDIYFDQLIPIFEKETGMYLRLFKKGGFVSTQNRDMVLGQLKSIHHHEEELKNALKTSGEIEAWVLAKVQRATTDLSDVTHYIDARKEFAKGGLVRNREYYHILSAPNNKFQLAYLGFGNLAKNITENSIVQRYTPLFNSKMEAERYFANIYGKLKDKDKKNATLIDSTVTPSTIVFANRGEIFNSFDPKVQEWNNLISEFLKSQKFAKGGGVYVTEIGFKRLQHEFKNDTEIFNGEVVQRGQNQFKIEKGILYVKRPNENWEKFSVIKYAKGGGVENLKVGDRVYGYFIYNYMGYQLVDYRMGGDLTYGEIKDVITENNQKKYVIKFENGETQKVSVGIFKEYLFVDKKYAKGGEIESFVYEDVEYPDSKTEIEDDEIDDFIEDWNERMETNYSSWEDFNKGEKYYKLRPIKEYSQGGMVDLFEDYTKIPRVVQRILDKHSEAFEDGGYDRLQKVIEEVEAVGYTFDYGMDGQAYGLRPIGVDITELSGYEEFAKGGITDDEALHTMLFENGGMPKGVLVADANPYIAGAKAVQGIAPQSVSALDQRLASKINPDPNRPVFFEDGGKISTKGFRVGDVLLAEYNWAQIPKPQYQVLEILGLEAPSFSGSKSNRLRLKDLQTGEEFFGNESRYSHFSKL